MLNVKRALLSAAIAGLSIVSLNGVAVRAQNTIPSFAASDGGNLVIYPQGGQPIRVTNYAPDSYSSIYDIAYTPDGNYVVFIASAQDANGNFTNSVSVVSAAGGDVFVIAQNMAIGIPLTFDADGQLVFAQDIPDQVVNDLGEYKIRLSRVPVDQPKAEVIGDVSFATGCGGGTSIPTQILYNSETSSLGGNGLTLAAVEGGYVLSSNCGGAGVNFVQPGSAISTIDTNLTRIAVSPNRKNIAGITFDYSDSGPINVRLLVGSVNQGAALKQVATMKPVDQLVWLNDNEIIYSTYENLGNIFTPEEQVVIAKNLGFAEGQANLGTLVDNRQVSIRKVNVDTGEDVELYATDPKPEAADNAYAVGRLRILPDGRVVYSLVPGVNSFARMLADGNLDMMNDPNAYDKTDELIEVQLYTLDVNTKQITQIGVNLQKAAFNPTGN